jgi:hypothetical protein
MTIDQWQNTTYTVSVKNISIYRKCLLVSNIRVGVDLMKSPVKVNVSSVPDSLCIKNRTTTKSRIIASGLEVRSANGLDGGLQS